MANVSSEITQRIRKLGGRRFWVRGRRNLYSVHYGKQVEFEEVYYGVIVMVLCDEDGVVYDV
ncbi:MAG: hypothetical protein N2606_04105 [Candidatus Omnitrophica bacterium]|nr:hypothetical protein [Candidatus Omnitrophota bacterium]